MNENNIKKQFDKWYREQKEMNPYIISEWFLNKFHTLQEEYKKAQTTCDSIFESYVEPYVVKRNEEYKKQIEERQKLFNFIPQDEYGYKRIKTSDLDIINIINS